MIKILKKQSEQRSGPIDKIKKAGTNLERIDQMHSERRRQTELKYLYKPELNRITEKYREFLNKAVNFYFFIDQGISRTIIPFGRKDRQKNVEIDNGSYIANKTALIEEITDSAHSNLINYYESLNSPNSDLDNKVLKLKEREKFNPNKKYNFENVYTIDLKNLKAVDIGGMADFLLQRVTDIVTRECEAMNEDYKDRDVFIAVYKIGGDEFSFIVKTNDSSLSAKIKERINNELIKENLCKIKTVYGTVNEDKTITRKAGYVGIKGDAIINDSRPKIKLDNLDTTFKALIYDLILAEIKIIPNQTDIDNVFNSIFKETKNLSDDQKLQKFNEYFLERFTKITEDVLVIPNFLDINEVNEERLLSEANKLAAKFPGLNILIDKAKQADILYLKDLERFSKAEMPNPEEDLETWKKCKNHYKKIQSDGHYHLRSIIQLLSKLLHDTAIGVNAYNKYHLTGLFEAGLINKFIVIKEVIKPVNDTHGLSNGDLNIRTLYEFIESKIPIELKKFIVLARDQADILLGINQQEIDKLQDGTEPGQKDYILNQITNFVETLKTISGFNLTLKTAYGSLNYDMPFGVGSDNFNIRSCPTQISNAYIESIENFHLNWFRLLAANADNLDNSYKSIKQNGIKLKDIVDTNPNIWFFLSHVLNPKRGLHNSVTALKILDQNKDFEALNANYSKIRSVLEEIIAEHQNLVEPDSKTNLEEKENLPVFSQ